jgi:hypothetical protein
MPYLQELILQNGFSLLSHHAVYVGSVSDKLHMETLPHTRRLMPMAIRATKVSPLIDLPLLGRDICTKGADMPSFSHSIL